MDQLRLSEDREQLFWKPVEKSSIHLHNVVAVHAVKEPTSIASSLGYRQWQLVIETTERDDLVFNTDDEACFNAWAHALSIFSPQLPEGVGSASSVLVNRGLGVGSAPEVASVEENEASQETIDLLGEDHFYDK